MNETIGETNVLETGSPSKFVLDFLVDNVDDTHRQLLEKGVVFLKEPHDRVEWNARLAHFRDPDGNLLEIYHSL
jgi:lactoylglutathione lyase